MSKNNSFASRLAVMKATLLELPGKIAELEAKIATRGAGSSDDDVVDLIVGDEYVFMFGRGESKTERTGKLIGTRVPPEGQKGGTIAKFIIGEGYDSEVVGVFPSAVLRNTKDPAPEASEVSTVDEVASEDPLRGVY